MAIVGLVLGILAIVLPYVFWYSWYFAFALGIAGIVLSAKSLNTQKGIAIAGLVISIIGTVIGLYWLVCAVECGSAAGALSGAARSLSF